MKDSLGDRMKLNYEDRFRNYLPRRIPCIIRIDGKAFHTFTKGFKRPFDLTISDAMAFAAIHLAEEAQGFKLAYVQSDECSILLTDYDQLETDAWFDYNKSKIETVSASCFTLWFNRHADIATLPKKKVAMFDARSFSMPREDVSNYFLWRAKDWERNSLAMYCGSFFSHKQLHGKGKQDKHDMLYSVGKNWTTDLEPRWKNGTWIVKTDSGLTVRHDIMPSYSDIEALVRPLITERPEDAN
jgi:tRNA(His) 5'-end guanylyltransferase